MRKHEHRGNRLARGLGRRALCGGVALAALGLAVPALAVAQEGLAPKPPPLSAWAREADIVLVNEVRKVLAADKVLAPLNLTVSARNGYVTLHGPVSSALDQRRAMDAASRVRGVVGLKNDLYLGDGPPRPPELVLGILPEPSPTHTHVASPYRGAGALDTGTVKMPAPAIPPILRRPREEGPGEGLPPIVRTNEVVEAPPPAAIRPVLLAPVGMGQRADRPGAVRPATPSSLQQAIAQARGRESRFALVQTEVRGAVVYLRTGRARPEDVTALGEELLKVPGVADVVMDD
jgi:hypothetical protein